MERKRKLPARAAARIEQAAKKGRTATPPDYPSATPSSALNSNSTPVPEEVEGPQKPPPPPLPTSIQPGKPLPTVEDAQPEDLPTKDYQTIQESGVLAESLSRSRQRWISDGLFEKYWTKPVKKKGVVQEDAKNPPKDSMAKVGQLIISLEPHYFEATMYAVKDPNKPAQQPVFRPILQYGPPNGAMPPPLTPSTKPPTPTTTFAAQTPPAVPAAAPAPAPAPAPSVMPSTTPTTHPTQSQTQTPALASFQPHPSSASQEGPRIAPATAPVPAPAMPVVSPRGMASVLTPSTSSPAPGLRPANLPQSLAPQVPKPSPPPSTSAALFGPSAVSPYPAPVPNQSPAPIASVHTPPQGSSRPGPPQNRPGQPVGTDPIIVTLAEKANEDPQLRDLMKRVANGNAPKDELARFQAIIDQITAESKRKGASQGPSADRLFVDGKPVRYFANEVEAIVTFVLRSNPKQRSADLSPPENSDPLVVSLVKAALDDPKTRDRVHRIAKNNTEFSDATDLKETLDHLKTQLTQQKPQSPAGPVRANGTTNAQPQGHVAQQPPPPPPPQQALRSKGPPPLVKPDVSAVVFEFAGGNGDRYLFPKFSIVEHTQTPSGPQVIASFLIVRKGSTSEYGGDPKLDYYQPVTIRISSTQPKHLEYFSRVVAPPEEVRRYMEDVMDNMTRAEYVLLAMRLPRTDKEVKEDSHASEKENKAGESNDATPELEDPNSRRKGLTWIKDKAVKKLSAKPASLKNSAKRIVSEDEQYQNFIASVNRKETEDEG